MVIHCDHPETVAGAMRWYGEVRALRPAFALGLVARRRDSASVLATCSHPVAWLLLPRHLVAGGVPGAEMEALRAASVEGRVLDMLVARYGDSLHIELPLVRCLIAHGVRGGTVASAARDFGRSVDTVSRRPAPLGVRSRELKRAARVLAYDVHRDLGATAAAALLACGWTDPEHLRRARARDRATERRRVPSTAQPE